MPFTVNGKSLITSSYSVLLSAVQRRIHSPSPSAWIVFICIPLSSDSTSESITEIKSLETHSFNTGFHLISFRVAFSGKTFAITLIFKLSLFNLVEPSANNSIFLEGIKSFSNFIVLSGDTPLHFLLK